MDEFEQKKDNTGYKEPIYGEPNETPNLVGNNFLNEQPDVVQDSSREEEIATEITADDYDEPSKTEGINDGTEVNSVFGWIGLALSVFSLFMFPIVAGGAGIVLGFISRSRGADMLGNTAIIVGAISIIISLFVLPFM